MYFVREFMHQLMEALEYVHQKGVSTNDILLYRFAWMMTGVVLK